MDNENEIDLIPSTPQDAFHEHLDRCTRCATSPFDLCDVGRRLLEAAARTPFPEDPGASGLSRQAATMVAGPTNEELFGPGPRILIGGRRGPSFAGLDMGHGPDRTVIRCVCLRTFTSVPDFNAHVARDHGQITKPMLERRGELLGVEGDELGQGRR